MAEKRVLYDGMTGTLPECIPLRAGPLTLIYEGGDLRAIRFGSHEIVRRIYMALRDHNWDTIAGKLGNLRTAIQPDAFQIDFDVEHKQGEIDFAWTGAITGSADGTVRYYMRGEARSTFLKNRIGLCVLHPADLAGTTFRVESSSTREAVLPERISPEQPVPGFGDMRALSYEVEPGLRAEVRLDGDLFEMEDQRNWTDASFKTFSTPLRLPYPARNEAGTVVEQTVTLRLVKEGKGDNSLRVVSSDAPTLISTTTVSGVSPISIRFDATQPGIPLPPIGLGFATHGEPLSQRELALLRVLRLDHLRVDLRPPDSDYPDVLQRATGQAEALGVRLHVGLIVPGGADCEVGQLRTLVASLQPPVAYWLIYPEKDLFNGGSETRAAVHAARAALENAVPGAKFAAGTNADLIFFQRTPPPVDLLNGVCFAINPQVHAFDNQSIVETLGAQSAAVRTARYYAGELPVLVSPITLRPRHNPYASAAAEATSAAALPPEVDPRQMSLLGAGWTVGSIAALSAGGAASLTYYETTGWRGVINTESGAPLPELFQAEPGAAYPLYHVLANVGAFAGGSMLPVQSSDPLAVTALAMRAEAAGQLILANVSAETRRVRVEGLPCNTGKSAEGPGPDTQEERCVVQMRRLDEANAEIAMEQPETFRALPAEPVDVRGGVIELELLPYGLAWLDWLEEAHAPDIW